jgi:hypothetical protein
MLALLALLAGCGGGDDGGGDTGSAAAPEPQGTSGGFTAYEVPSEGFAISVPEAWKAVSVDDVKESGAFERFAQENPEFQPYVEAFSGPNSVLKFIAIDPERTKDFSTNANVTVEPLPAGTSREQYLDAVVAKLGEIGVAEGDVEQETVKLPAGEADRISYESNVALGDVERALATLQYLIVANDKAYVLTYTALPELAEQSADDFAASAESFRLL